jgi:hypothetical protein
MANKKIESETTEVYVINWAYLFSHLGKIVLRLGKVVFVKIWEQIYKMWHVETKKPKEDQTSEAKRVMLLDVSHIIEEYSKKQEISMYEAKLLLQLTLNKWHGFVKMGHCNIRTNVIIKNSDGRYELYLINEDTGCKEEFSISYFESSIASFLSESKRIGKEQERSEKLFLEAISPEFHHHSAGINEPGRSCFEYDGKSGLRLETKCIAKKYSHAVWKPEPLSPGWRDGGGDVEYYTVRAPENVRTVEFGVVLKYANYATGEYLPAGVYKICKALVRRHGRGYKTIRMFKQVD